LANLPGTADRGGVDELVDGSGALDLAHLDSLRHRTL
jgi:hypothetical protein